MHSQRVRHDWATELNWIEIYAYIKCFLRIYFGASKVALMVKNLPASAPDGRSRGVQPPDQGDRVRKEMATHSSILAGRIPWTEEPGRQQSAGSKIVWHHWPQCSSKKIFYQLLPSGRGLGVSAEEVTFHFQWLRLCLPVQQMKVRSLVRDYDPTSHGVWPKSEKDSWDSFKITKTLSICNVLSWLFSFKMAGLGKIHLRTLLQPLDLPWNMEITLFPHSALFPSFTRAHRTSLNMYATQADLPLYPLQ